MEIVLLWLDDLDDLVFSAALAWEQLRRLCLNVGLVAAFALVACEVSMTASQWASRAAVAVAVASVVVWLLGALFAAARRLEARFA
jgi:hypothetical protein